ncbi:hypothetical protein GW17_00034378 [Ensete ventricosum]|nr:hypothetical protein GW17_00034378 [Ensete ventricosum]
MRLLPFPYCHTSPPVTSSHYPASICFLYHRGPLTPSSSPTAVATPNANAPTALPLLPLTTASRFQPAKPPAVAVSLLPPLLHCCPSCSPSIVNNASSSTVCCLSPPIVVVLPRSCTTIASVAHAVVVLPCRSPRCCCPLLLPPRLPLHPCLLCRYYHRPPLQCLSLPALPSSTTKRPLVEPTSSSSYLLPHRTLLLVRPSCSPASSSSSNLATSRTLLLPCRMTSLSCSRCCCLLTLAISL